MSKILLVQGDTRPNVVFTVIDESTGVAADLSSVSTAQLRLRQAGSTTVKEAIACTKIAGFKNEDGTINTSAPYDVPGAGGRLQLSWTSTALDTAGEFDGELELTFTDGSIQTIYDLFKFKVRAQL